MTIFRRGFWAALLPLGLIVVALLPDPGAALPTGTYYFRDFSLGFYPLRQFQASELAAGRLPFWNPYVHEGEFMLPSLYPFDLLHVVNSSPEFVSWLLTLHLPLAALGAYALGRAQGMSRAAAFATGSVYAIGGFSLSTLNLYTFLQALALAPWIVMTMERAAVHGGRWIPGAALAFGVGLTTLAMEILAQTVLIGALFVLTRKFSPGGPSIPIWRSFARLAAGLALGIGLAGIPVTVILGVLPETVRGIGFVTEEAGGLSLPPAALLQAIMPSAYMSLNRPFEAWWGNALFVDGPPYFISIYVGVLALSIALAGAVASLRSERVMLLAVAILGAWYALGPAGGLWSLLRDVPFADSFRTPAKSWFATHLALAILIGYGIDYLMRARQWHVFGKLTAAGTALLTVLALLSMQAGEPVKAWFQMDARAYHEFIAVFPRDAFVTAAVAALGSGLAVAVVRQWIRAEFAAGILVAMVVIDLVRAGAGVNRQAPPMFFKLLPDIAAEQLDQLDGGRVFVYPATRSRIFRAWLEARVPDGDLWAFYANRQQLDPYNNIIDRIETAASSDRTRFSPLLTALGWTGYEPEQIGNVLPYLRHAGVSRITSFDPLMHAELRLRRVVPIARTGLSVHIYSINGALPRARVACSARFAPSRIEAAHMALNAEFDPLREIVLEQIPPPRLLACTKGVAHAVSMTPDKEIYEVQADGAGWLAVRSTHARGWHAWIDDHPASLSRADGRHKAVAIPAGRHTVELRYEPPGLRPAIGLTLLSALIVAVWLAIRSPADAGRFSWRRRGI